MAKHNGYKTVSSGKAAAGKVVERNLMGVNPLKKQFEPTPASPVRQHFKMAGGAS